MTHRQSSHIKRAQKESLLLKELSNLLLQIALDDPRVAEVFISRVQLSRDKSICTVFFYTEGGPDTFKEKLDILVLYKPSIRKAIAGSIQSRYVPQLIFAFDEQFEKQRRVEEILEQVKEH